MHDDPSLGIVIVVIELLFMASMVAVVSRNLRFPFTIGLVIAGLVLGWASRSFPALQAATGFQLTPGAVLFIFLPALLFHSSFNLDARNLLKNALPVSMLAVPALLISTATVGFIAHHALGLGLGEALLFGALISATDPVAVVALFEEMGAPKRLHLLVEGESLFNDGTALVVFKVILAALLAGTFTHSAIVSGLVQFVVVSAGGIMLGILFGVVFSWMISGIHDNPLVEIALTTILAHCSFIVAEQFLHVSGVMATVASGLTLGGYGRNKITPQVLGHLESFWEYFAFVCNSLIFLLVGLSIDPWNLVDNAYAILVGAAAVLVARAISVYGVFSVVERLKIAEPTSRAFQTVIFWGGLRGALAIVMVMSIPDSMEIKPFLVALTFGVVLTNILVNGLTVKPLMLALGLNEYSAKESLERLQAMLAVKEKTRAKVMEFASLEGLETGTARARRESYDESIAGLSSELARLRESVGARDEYEVALGHCLLMEKAHYRRLFREGMLSENGVRDMLSEADRLLDRLKEKRPVIRDTRPSVVSRIAERLPDDGVMARMAWRLKAGVISARYERARARLSVSTSVLKDLVGMRKHGAVSDEVAGRVELLYTDLRQNSVAAMEEVWSEYPGYVEGSDAGMLERFCLNSEVDEYRELYLSGAVSEKVFIEKRDEITTLLRKIGRRGR